MNPGLKSLLWLALGGTLLSVVSFVIWISVNRNIDGLVFGRVVFTSPTVISIADRDERMTNILVNSGTLIIDQRTNIAPEDIPIGQFVQVKGERMQKDVIQADTIWLMSPLRKGNPHEAPR